MHHPFTNKHRTSYLKPGIPKNVHTSTQYQNQTRMVFDVTICNIVALNRRTITETFAARNSPTLPLWTTLAIKEDALGSVEHCRQNLAKRKKAGRIEYNLPRRMTRDSNPQPIARYLSSSETAHQFAYHPEKCPTILARDPVLCNVTCERVSQTAAQIFSLRTVLRYQSKAVFAPLINLMNSPLFSNRPNCLVSCSIASQGCMLLSVLRSIVTAS